MCEGGAGSTPAPHEGLNESWQHFTFCNTFTVGLHHCCRLFCTASRNLNAIRLLSRRSVLSRLLGASRVWLCRSATVDRVAGLACETHSWHLTTGATLLACTSRRRTYRLHCRVCA